MRTIICICQRFRVPSLVLLTTVILMGGFSLPARAAGGLFSSVSLLTEPTQVNHDQFGNGCNGGTVLSADGQTALVAAPYATVGTVPYAGKTYIYHFANGQWTLAQEIDDPGSTANDEFGDDLSVNGNGTVALIGSFAAVNGQANAGKAYLYTLSNGSWVQSHEFDDPAATTGDYFSHCDVALSTDGQTAGIAAAYKSVNGMLQAGEAYIYIESNGTWTQSAAIPDPDKAANDQFSAALAVSGDGKSALMGSEAAVNSQANAGKAYLYTLSNGSWVQSHEFDDPAETQGDIFGWNNVSLSSDGQTAAIAASGTRVNGLSSAGEAYIYSESNGTWTQADAIPDPDEVAYDHFGAPLRLSADGTTALIGSFAAVNGQTGAGKAYLYTLTNGSWVQPREFDDPVATANDDFGGYGVALSGDGETAFMSAPGTTITGIASAGEAYIYQSPDDLSLALTATPASIAIGQSVVLDATMTNTDTTVTAYNVILTGTLPAGLTYTSSNAAGGTCAATGQTVTCTLASLAPGATWQPSITGNASAMGSLTANATVASNEPDPNAANNNASVTTAVTPPPPAASNGSVTTAEGVAVNGTLSATGTDPLTFTVAAQPSDGKVSITNAAIGAFTYTPNSGYSGTDSFTFTANNSGGASNTGTESVTVTASSSGSGGLGGSGSSGGGGGAFGLLSLLMIGLPLLSRRGRK